ncbi:FadR/GntR family transcriptional regulator [Curtobacterium sp. S6]|uniref:FadR/GntR family transcriptional regulator n=1 Tax=Curtobacterium sp. S6 TaxID=1479623 RepID=UPI0004AA9F9C|nr:FadR/GntR family transcriptional regulator [Curtobacterium sp. S6]
MSRNLAERVGRKILDRIAEGDYRIGEELPSEAVLAEELDVSRLTIREAIKNLAGRGVILVQHGKRNRLAPLENWDLLNVELMKLRGSMRGERRNLVEQLTEVRHVVEIGAAELAAVRITPSRLGVLRRHLEEMKAAESATGAADVERAVEADIAFHRTIIEAAGNEFLQATYRPLEEVLRAVRLETSAAESVRREAIHWHGAILERLESHDPEGAREAMRSHMNQTMNAVREETA